MPSPYRRSRQPGLFGVLPEPQPPSLFNPPRGPGARTSGHIGHPGFAESLIPVWGSGREALADWQDGDYAGAALNGALAASDVFLAGALAKGLAKGAIKVTGPHVWNAAPRVVRELNQQGQRTIRQWMLEKGLLEKWQIGHHWAIPQNGWGKAVPDWLKNQPWNIKALPDKVVHTRIHSNMPSRGLKRFNPAERWWYGTPAWSKAAVASGAGRPAATLEEAND